MEDECWLPELIVCEDLEKWEEYEDLIYSEFVADFIDSNPTFHGRRVQIRKHPIEFEREDAFWHVTCCDYSKNKERNPDLRRCERIKWIRAFIENYECNGFCCDECDGLYIWSTIYKPTKSPRFKILFEEERYVVIVEQREKYCLLITAYYIDQEHRLEKMLKEYEKVKKQEAPHQGRN